MQFHEYAGADALFDALTAQIAGEIEAAIVARGQASLSVPGGTTPGPLFDRLAEAPLDWARVAVFLNDERWVDETSPRSNTALLKQRFLVGRAAAARLIPLYAPAPAPEDQLAALSQGLRAHLPIDVLLLGMGADMHTASLFPGADLLAEALHDDAPPLMALRAEAAGEPRITLTAPYLRSARHVHVLMRGAEKRRALDAAARLPAMQAPIQIVLDKAHIHWAE